ncbi:hypothetical protein PVL29_015040 [Vitis rotundifolia]|uniref:Uncharacterized protein n=1 Tax=Vitis rotundifolia TaxID=103349 RepID=A0AA38ZCD4_VITRO|nr:hypothetical protein PVL29_015040 [Vitis rotundifolia]
MPNENNSELWPQNPGQNFTTVTTWRGNSFTVYTPMALNLISASTSLHPSPSPPSPSPFLIPKHRLFKLCSSSSCFRTSAQSGGTEGVGVTQEDPPLPATLSESPSSARSQLDLLEQLTSTRPSLEGGYESDGMSRNLTIRDQLARLVGERDDDFIIPLGKNLKKVSPKFLTISQKRNIKRQAYLNEVSQRNDSVFFATIGAFVILPPIIILGIAIITGYVQLFP